MLRRTFFCASRRFDVNLKFPSLVSYNKLPWEILNHQTPALHMHLAPQYEQVLSAAASVSVPHLCRTSHPTVNPTQQLRVLPGMLYLQPGETLPSGFTAHDVADPTALQYYGRLSSTIAPVQRVRLLTSEDLRLLCVAVTFNGSFLSVAPYATLAQVGVEADRAAPVAEASSTPSSSLGGTYTLFHYFRPNRPASELTRPLEKYFVQHPSVGLLASYAHGSPSSATWTPRLNAPKRAKKDVATPLPPYRPPQSYVMSLAERWGVKPGDSFGRRSLMWGHWF